MKNIVIGCAVLLVAAVGVYFLWQSTSTVTYEAAVTEDNAVLLVDQPSKDEVVVSYAKLSKPGYVVVQSVNSSTGRGEVLGASTLLAAGEYKNLRVPTRHNTGTNEGKVKIRASVVADNGDGQYSTSDIEVLVDATETTEAEVDPAAEDPTDLSAEDIVDLLDDAGYTVDDTAADAIDELHVDASGDVMVDDEAMEGEGNASGTVEEGTILTPEQSENEATI